MGGDEGFGYRLCREDTSTRKRAQKLAANLRKEPKGRPLM